MSCVLLSCALLSLHRWTHMKPHAIWVDEITRAIVSIKKINKNHVKTKPFWKYSFLKQILHKFWFLVTMCINEEYWSEHFFKKFRIPRFIMPWSVRRVFSRKQMFIHHTCIRGRINYKKIVFHLKLVCFFYLNDFWFFLIILNITFYTQKKKRKKKKQKCKSTQLDILRGSINKNSNNKKCCSICIS